jgi:hypothetical protein
VGASLLAMVVYQSILMSTDTPLSRASPPPQGFVVIFDQWLSGPFIIAWFATDMNAVVITDFTGTMYAMVITDFTGTMDTVVITDFTGMMDTVVITDFTGTMDTVVITHFT